MPLQATSGAASYDAFGGGVPIVPAYIEEVFSTWLYTGSGANRTITNGIDLSTNGGLVWTKNRNSSLDHELMDTQRGAGFGLRSNGSEGQVSGYSDGSILSFNTDGYSLGFNADWNFSTDYTYASWTFRKQPKFFDIQTWTGTGANRTISHSLNSVPACIMVKRTDTSGSWQVYHRSLANTEYMVLNSLAAVATGATRWNSTTPTSTVFSLGTDATVNASGGTYVAYLFAHNAGGFGLTGTDNVISCGSFTTGASGNASVTLGYEPQWVMFRVSSSGDNWFINDSMRGMPDTSSSSNRLYANTSGAEITNQSAGVRPTSTGFNAFGLNGSDPGGTVIYIAIRRGPMKVPTTGTSVFSPQNGRGATDGTPNANAFTTNFPVDMFIATSKSSGINRVLDRLRGKPSALQTSSTSAEITNTFYNFDDMDGIWGSISDPANSSICNWAFRRAPSVFDVVCYTGTGVARTVAHNLAAVPELMIVKGRTGAPTYNWICYHKSFASNQVVELNTTTGVQNNGGAYDISTLSSTVFGLLTGADTNGSGNTHVAYLFATCPGVSKVGSYTGNGTTQAIACGFTGGARFVLIKRTDASGDWYVYDTARGMTVLTDPFLLLNSTVAETATLGSVITSTGGFTVNAAILAAINTNAASYIFLAIA